LTGATDRAERVRERIEEDREALARAGCGDALALGLLDEQYRTEPVDAAGLREAIESALPVVSELWAPAGIGGHADHRLVRDAALAIARDSGVPLTLYADLPYAARHGWPGWVRRRRSGLDVDAWWESFLPIEPHLEPRAHRLPRAERRRKLRALGAYRTQIEPLGVGRLTRREVIGYEVSFSAG
jgi:LmbE family N-acetylglucosaminyl deacetylase